MKFIWEADDIRKGLRVKILDIETMIVASYTLRKVRYSYTQLTGTHAGAVSSNFCDAAVMAKVLTLKKAIPLGLAT